MRNISPPISARAALFRHGGCSITGARPTLDFSVSVNPLGPPPSVLDRLRDELHSIAHYPDPECRRLTERLAALHGLSPGHVVIGNGSNELIHVITQAFRSRRVAIVEPTYTEYLRAALLAGSAVDHWLPGEPPFAPETFDPAGVELVWLCNPNNPTGQLWRREQLREWIGRHRSSIFIVDEAFLPFLPDETEHSLIPILAQLPNLIVLRSLTKILAVPGLRLGYAVARPEMAERIRSRLQPWAVNTLAQIAGVVGLEDTAFLAETRAWFAAEPAYLAQQLEKLSASLTVLPSRANFVLLRLHQGKAASLAARLLERGLAVRDAANFVGLDEGYVRVGVRSRTDNDRLLAELPSALAEG